MPGMAGHPHQKHIAVLRCSGYYLVQQLNLQGRVQFPTGGVANSEFAEPATRVASTAAKQAGASWQNRAMPVDLVRSQSRR